MVMLGAIDEQSYRQSYLKCDSLWEDTELLVVPKKGCQSYADNGSFTE